MPDSLLARCRDVIREVPHDPGCASLEEDIHNRNACSCLRDERLAAGLAACITETRMEARRSNNLGADRFISIVETTALAAFREAAGAPEGTP